MGFFDELQQSKELITRTSESMGGVYGDPFNEVATVISVSDPKKLGRVKVQYTDTTVSDWVYVLNNTSGVLSAQYIGMSVLIGKAHGNSHDAFVLGFFSKDSTNSLPGAPLQAPVVNLQKASNRGPTSPGDKGLECNVQNANKIYIMESEQREEIVICKRVNNLQEDAEPIYNWWNLGGSKWVEKGNDPGVEANKSVVNFSEKRGIPECTKASEGQLIDFTEDKKFRNYSLKCSKDENGNYTWKPNNATPVFFRSNLPNCTEKLHGMEAILDEGLNSTPIKCIRYHNTMKWCSWGKRDPIQFHPKDAPPTHQEFLDSKKEMPALESPTSDFNAVVDSASPNILGALVRGIPAVSEFSPLSASASAAGIATGEFNESLLLTEIGNTVIDEIDNTVIDEIDGGESSFDPVVGSVENSLTQEGITDPEVITTVDSLKETGTDTVNGVQNDDLNSEDTLLKLGRDSLKEALNLLPSDVRSIYYGYMIGGIAGAIDSAALAGVSSLPKEMSQIIKPIVSEASEIMKSQPQSINSVLNSAVGLTTGLPIGNILSSMVEIVGTTNAPRVLESINAGDLGPVATTITPFSNLSSIPTLGDTDLPALASTTLELAETGEQFSDLLSGGIGLDETSKLLDGVNPVAGLLNSAVGGLLGGGSSDCPCGPKCRKTEHSEDSDGNILLEKCGNVIANSHSSYAPENDPTKNNENEVAELLGYVPTLLGSELCVPNLFDLTEMIQEVKRLGEMADRFESSRNADWPEMWTELSYTFETIEKAFKQTDRNISKIEGTLRKVIDSQARLINRTMSLDGSFLPKMLLNMVDSNKAIQDVYLYVQRLDAIKHGGGAGVGVTPSLGTTFKNIVKIAEQIVTTQAEATFQFNNFIDIADQEWRDMNPAKGLQEIQDLLLGISFPLPDISSLFGKCVTQRDENEALKTSLEATLNSPVPGGDINSPLDLKLSADSRDRAKSRSLLPSEGGTPQISTLLDQIQYEQGRAKERKADC